jgi:hypothetical protein
MISGWLQGLVRGTVEGGTDDHTITMGKLSQLAYRSPEEREREAKLLGYTYDRELSHDRTAVFAHPMGTVVAYRGSQDSGDWMTNVGIAGNVDTTPRFQEAVDEGRRAKQKYGIVAFTGHSLGGTLADRASRELGAQATVFNPGKSPLGLTRFGPRTRVIRNTRDPVSAGHLPGSWQEAVASVSAGAHGVDQFTSGK